ncbi:hypothetical protein DQ04_16981000, partial [Trypanosoma grayi]|uniref:hypothetical protein n=1 Tax=Trypanosoma grayi TaxID=71804 RepID=UPI0004F43EB1
MSAGYLAPAESTSLPTSSPSSSAMWLIAAAAAEQPATFLHTRDEVLKCIKTLLQPAYDGGCISRAHFVFVAKQTLLFVMGVSGLGAQRYSTAFVAEALQLQLMQVVRPSFSQPQQSTTTASLGPSSQSETNGGGIDGIANEGGALRCYSQEAAREQQEHNHQQQQQQCVAGEPTTWRSQPYALPDLCGGCDDECGNAEKEGGTSGYYFPAPFARCPVPSCASSRSSCASCPFALPQRRQRQQQEHQQQQRNDCARNNGDTSAASVSGTVSSWTVSPIGRARVPAEDARTVVATPTKSSPVVGHVCGNCTFSRLDGVTKSTPSLPSATAVTCQGWGYHHHHQQQQTQRADEKEEIEQKWVDDEDAALLHLVRQLRAGVASQRSEDEDEAVVVVRGEEKVKPEEEERQDSPCLTSRTAATSTGGATLVVPLSDVASIVNACLAQRNIMQQWALGRQELLRCEEHAFISLLLQLQQFLIMGVMRHAMGVEEEPATLSPPPKEQFECVTRHGEVDTSSSMTPRVGEGKGEEPTSCRHVP